MPDKITAGLFGLENSNRDFSNPKSWGKNMFNSGFPAALCCYLASKNLPITYIKLDSELSVMHDLKVISDIFGGDTNKNEVEAIVIIGTREIIIDEQYLAMMNLLQQSGA